MKKMSMERERRCSSSLLVNREVLVTMLCCLVVVCKSVDSKSISELLLDFEMEDSSQFLPQQLVSSDDYDDLAGISDDLSQKRTPWAPHEVNVENLRQKLLRPKLFNGRQKHASPQYRDGSAFTEHVSELSPRDAFADGYMAGWLSARAQFLGGEVDGAGQTETDLMDVLRKLGKREDPDQERQARVRSASSIHPVYLGMGQETASAALSTFASLLAEEEKRKNSDLPTNPVRFIGKRYSTDE